MCGCDTSRSDRAYGAEARDTSRPSTAFRPSQRMMPLARASIMRMRTDSVRPRLRNAACSSEMRRASRPPGTCGGWSSSITFGRSNSFTKAASRAIGENSTTDSDGSNSRNRSSSPPARSMLPALVPCGTETKMDRGVTVSGVGRGAWGVKATTGVRLRRVPTPGRPAHRPGCRRRPRFRSRQTAARPRFRRTNPAGWRP